jgi:hypothetical protein
MCKGQQRTTKIGVLFIPINGLLLLCFAFGTGVLYKFRGRPIIWVFSVKEKRELESLAAWL